MHADKEMLNQITERIIGCAYRVGNELGYGFLEKVYENALKHELVKTGLRVDQQFPIAVYYDGVEVGKYFADLLVEGVVLIELKSVRTFDDIHAAQCINYLVATRLPICLLINFGKRADVRRYASMRGRS